MGLHIRVRSEGCVVELTFLSRSKASGALSCGHLSGWMTTFDTSQSVAVKKK